MEKRELVLCDTNILIEFYKENLEIIESLHSIGSENIAISIVTAGELLYGALNKNELNHITRDLLKLELINITQATSDIFINLMVKYTLSHNLSLPDGLIAATAITEEIPLYTFNSRDFRYTEGLKLYRD